LLQNLLNINAISPAVIIKYASMDELQHAKTFLKNLDYENRSPNTKEKIQCDA